MTVSELIEVLQKFPPDYPVFIYDYADDATAYLNDPQPGAEDVYLPGIDINVKAVTLN